MKIYLYEMIVPFDLLDGTKDICELYSIMIPTPSDHFKSLNEVICWLNGLKMSERLKYIEDDTIMIYKHAVSCKDQLLESGYNAKKGEVLSTDESYSFHWHNNRWTPWNEMPDYVEPNELNMEIKDIEL